MDNTASFKINRGIVTHLKLFPLFGEYNNTLIWALLANDYIKNAGYTLRQARVITQYKKYKRTVSDVERLVVYYDDLEYLFKTRLVIYEGDYSEARVHGKSIIPSTVRIIYDGSAVEYESTTYIYRIYKDEWVPNKSQHQNSEYMYVLIPDHDAFISRFEGMKIVNEESIRDSSSQLTLSSEQRLYDEYCKEVMSEERSEERSDEQRQRLYEQRQRREVRLYEQRKRRDMYNTVITLPIAEHTDRMIPQWLFSY